MCEDHFRKAHVQRQKSSGKHIPPQTTESLLASLSHYTRSTKIEENKSVSCQEDNETADISQSLSKPTKALNPFGNKLLLYYSSNYIYIFHYAIVCLMLIPPFFQ